MNSVSDLRQIQAAVASMFWNKPAMRVVLAKHMFQEFLLMDDERAARPKVAAWRWCIADAGGDEGKARRLCQAEVHSD